jgi:hypothetical protein
MTREQTVTMDVGLLHVADEWFVDVTVDRELFWRSEPFDTESEARAALEDFRSMIEKYTPRAAIHDPTELQ